MHVSYSARQGITRIRQSTRLISLQLLVHQPFIYEHDMKISAGMDRVAYTRYTAYGLEVRA